MKRAKEITHTIDEMLDTKRKRHIIGGILLGTSLFFGVLAFTTMTIKHGG
jgi:hypothetical protein